MSAAETHDEIEQDKYLKQYCKALLIFAQIKTNINNNLFGEVLDVRMSIDVVFLSNFVLEEVPRIIFTQALHLDTLTPHVIADLVVPRREDDFLPAPK